MRMRTIAFVLTLAACVLALGGCRDTGQEQDGTTAGTDTPAAAVRQLTAHLIADDLSAFARQAVTPELHERLETAWREGRTRWPLDELPLSDKHPDALAALAADGAEATLRRSFDRQFANAATELRQTASALGLFGAQYVQMQGEYSASEREHFTQLIAAFSQWAMQAPLTDRERAVESIDQLAAAARQAALISPEAFAEAGMHDALQRMAPVIATAKQALQRYGLDLDAALAGMQVHLQSQTGDSAKVRITYTFADTPIDTVTHMERRDGRWYVSDFLLNAEAAADAQ